MANKTLHLKKILVLTASAIVLVILMVTINNRAVMNSPLLPEGGRKLAVMAEVSAVSNSGSMVSFVDNLMIEAGTDGIRAKNIKGEIAWSQKLSGAVQRIAEAGNNIVVTDSEKNVYYFSLQGKLLWSYKMPLELIDIYTGESGSVLLEYKGLTGSRIEVFNRNGTKIGNISVDNSYVLAFAAGDGMFSISILDTSSDTLKSKVITYGEKGDIVWAKNFDDLIIASVNYFKNNRIIAASEDSLYSFKEDGSLQSTIDLGGKLQNIVSNGYMSVAVINSKGKSIALCYDMNLKQMSRVEIKASPLGIYPSKNSYMIYYKDEILMLSPKGNVMALYKSNTNISEAYMTADNKVYLASNRSLQLLEYK